MSWKGKSHKFERGCVIYFCSEDAIAINQFFGGSTW
jgi:hypothetical protein